MFGFFKRNNSSEETTPYDPNTQIPIIKSSVCTGEKIACFQNKETHKLTEIMLIANDQDLANFCHKYQINPKDLKYIYP